jgi:hypothetical protein
MKTKPTKPIMSQDMIDRHIREAQRNTEPTPEAILDLAEKFKPMLAGKHPSLIGGVLAELTAIWLASHIGENPKDTGAMRAQLLAMQMLAIADLAAEMEP